MKYRIWGGIVLLLVLLFAANLFLGSARIPFRAVLGILVGEEGEKTAWTYIVWQTRFPQAVTALFSGASLAVAGLMLQTVFANPLAGPSILGIDSGASLGVAFGDAAVWRNGGGSNRGPDVFGLCGGCGGRFCRSRPDSGTHHLFFDADTQ